MTQTGWHKAAEVLRQSPLTLLMNSEMATTPQLADGFNKGDRIGSGGQWQKIALARAFMARKTPIF